ncbi:MAG: HEAT repeat domain-containing protein [Acidobacteria bacterium]|nr:HEAT repeat domain-containing protein [Acidobacteriota bacterium]
MGLFDFLRPKWKHSNPDVRIAAARATDDVEVLKKLATDDRDWFVRHRVFDEIRDRNLGGDSIYADLAKNSVDEEIRRKAIKKLSDEVLLADIAKNEKFRYVRDAAEHRLDELQRNIYGEKPEPQSPEPQSSAPAQTAG